MDSVTSQVPSASESTESPLAPGREHAAEDAEDPYSPEQLAFTGLLGGLIALATLILPLGAVLASRPQTPLPAAGLASPRAAGQGAEDPQRR
jgi:hypothetical protein